MHAVVRSGFRVTVEVFSALMARSVDVGAWVALHVVAGAGWPAQAVLLHSERRVGPTAVPTQASALVGAGDVDRDA